MTKETKQQDGPARVTALSNDSAPPDCAAHDMRAGEQGWALLGVLLALSVIAIVMVSSVVPNVKMTVQREKEAELIYRGEQMAKAIARYYNGGRLGYIRILAPPPYGYLTELKKLRDGVRIGVTEIKFVRGSAFIDPMSSEEWEPVLARDPRIKKYLDYYTAATGVVIPQDYWLLAGPPERLQLTNPSSPGAGGRAGETQPGQSAPGQTAPGQSRPSQPRIPGGEPDSDEDEEEEDEDEIDDPLAHIFDKDLAGSPGRSNIPIVGVAPKRKGKAVRSYYGLENYEEWVFLFVPDPRQMPVNPGMNPRLPNTNRPRISQ